MGIYFIELESFKQLIQRDGFGAIYGNDCGEEKAFVTIEVLDKGLIAEFIRVGKSR